ncbi:MAG TPA: ABC transporter ATP-binding protein [Paludibacteraceae bacterium]|nr:ABC transporter ATP-binding protein [Paludibacteraceae bacterium]HQF50360.1 ABC transporter ATP-binding protein [Paludibacteraceae bacterium]HQJ89236.1 ABC transporter ATP-binding protein [Paludibacteraceae bacterium]
MIQVNDIQKSYGKAEALKGISFSVDKGEIFGIIGPDGAGKTTAFRILTTLLLADKGEAFVDKLDVKRDFKKIRKMIGYMPGHFSLYPDLSVEENLELFASVFGTTIQQNYHLIEDIYRHIEPFKTRRAEKLSGGMKQKLALCCALIHAPKVIFLDEPTTGVDPTSRKEFWQMLKKLKAQGITILVSTPYMDEATLCDRIALIKDGRFLSVQTPQETVNRFNENLYETSSTDMFRLLTDLRKNSEVKDCYTFGASHHLLLKNDSSLEALKKKMLALGHQDIVIRPTEVTIEDCFMKLTKE